MTAPTRGAAGARAELDASDRGDAGTARHVYAVTFVRHGRTDYNAAGRLQGQVDIPLNDVGRWQAHRTAMALADAYVRDSGRTPVVVSSPLVRAQETAGDFASLVGAQVHVDERVKERGFGEWEGCRWSDLEQRQPRDFELWKRFQDGEMRHGAESKASVGHRGAQAVTQWATEYDESYELFVFSHGAWISQTIQRLMHLDVVDPTYASVSGPNNGHWCRFRVLGTMDGTLLWRLMEFNRGPVVPDGVQWNDPFASGDVAAAVPPVL